MTGRPAVSDRTLIFLHLPKCAGTTLKLILLRQYGLASVQHIVRERIDAFAAAPEAEKRKLRAVGGHMPFGLHQHLPQPCTYITLLRHPIDRLVSLYYHVLRQRTHYLHDVVENGRMTLADCVSNGISVEFDNGQTRDLAGEGIVAQAFAYNNVPYGQCSPALLTRAKQHLADHFVVAGLSERFDETLLLTARALGWTQAPYYSKENVGRNRPANGGGPLPKATVSCIERYNALDFELYEYVSKRFDEQMTQDGAGLAWAVRKFRIANASTGKLRLLSWQAQRILAARRSARQPVER